MFLGRAVEWILLVFDSRPLLLLKKERWKLLGVGVQGLVDGFGRSTPLQRWRNLVRAGMRIRLRCKLRSLSYVYDY